MGEINMFKTKIWKLKKNVSFYNKVVNVVPKKTGTEPFWDELKRAIIMNNPLDYNQFSALYYGVSLCRTVHELKQPDVVIVSLEDVKNMDQLEKDLQNPYGELTQNLYITLALTKENGKEFAEGSLKYTEQQYKEFHEMIMKEISEDMKQIAEKYVKNLHMMNARTTI
ncbi:hypothetical protein BC30102_p806 (plasmid) [Bacillus cereus]|nr:hypothetical protein BC30102_p806 [Bacillus cereus]